MRKNRYTKDNPLTKDSRWLKYVDKDRRPFPGMDGTTPSNGDYAFRFTDTGIGSKLIRLMLTPDGNPKKWVLVPLATGTAFAAMGIGYAIEKEKCQRDIQQECRVACQGRPLAASGGDRRPDGGRLRVDPAMLDEAYQNEPKICTEDNWNLWKEQREGQTQKWHPAHPD